MIGVGVLYTTREAKVVRNYLLACAIADVGHLYATYAVMYVLPASVSPVSSLGRCWEGLFFRPCSKA